MSDTDVPQSKFDRFETEFGETYTKEFGEYLVTLSGYPDEFRDVLEITDSSGDLKQKLSGDRDMVRDKFISIESVSDVESHF